MTSSVYVDDDWTSVFLSALNDVISQKISKQPVLISADH